MKLLAKWVLAGTLAFLAIPIAAQAHEWREHRFYQGYGYGWRYRDTRWDRRDMRHDWRDIAHDRYELRGDLANGNWRAARAEQADIYRDLRDVRRDRHDLYRDYHGVPGPYSEYAPYVPRY